MQLTIEIIDKIIEHLDDVFLIEDENSIKHIVTDIQYMFRPNGNFVSPFAVDYHPTHIRNWLEDACSLLKTYIARGHIFEIRNLSINLQKLIFICV